MAVDANLTIQGIYAIIVHKKRGFDYEL